MGSEEIRFFHNDDRPYDEWVTQHMGYILTARDAVSICSTSRNAHILTGIRSG